MKNILPRAPRIFASVFPVIQVVLMVGLLSGCVSPAGRLSAGTREGIPALRDDLRFIEIRWGAVVQKWSHEIVLDGSGAIVFRPRLQLDGDPDRYEWYNTMLMKCEEAGNEEYRRFIASQWSGSAAGRVSRRTTRAILENMDDYRMMFDRGDVIKLKGALIEDGSWLYVLMYDGKRLRHTRLLNEYSPACLRFLEWLSGYHPLLRDALKEPLDDLRYIRDLMISRGML